MQIKAHQLEAHLQSLSPCYLISGDDPFLHQQACDQIRAAAKQAGCSERKILEVETGFNWGEFSLEFNSLSLFADKRLIELRLLKNNLDKEAFNAIATALDSGNTDVCLLLSMPKIHAASKHSAWFKCIDKHGLITQIWPLDSNQMQQWLQKYAAAKKLTLDTEAVLYLCAKNHNNLLTASQEIEKLHLQFNSGAHLSLGDLEALLQQNSIYSAFDLSHSFLMRDRKKSSLQLQFLKESGEEPSLILWVLLRDLRLLSQCILQVNKGLSIQSVLAKHSMPEKQKNSLLAATQYNSEKRIKKLFALCLEIERAIKGLSTYNVWLLLARLLLH